ncbi:hypothetical protein T439DRAFT_207558 [Meredithblackwellia eburnea MCA 4105]
MSTPKEQYRLPRSSSMNHTSHGSIPTPVSSKAPQVLPRAPSRIVQQIPSSEFLRPPPAQLQPRRAPPPRRWAISPKAPPVPPRISGNFESHGPIPINQQSTSGHPLRRSDPTEGNQRSYELVFLEPDLTNLSCLADFSTLANQRTLRRAKRSIADAIPCTAPGYFVEERLGSSLPPIDADFYHPSHEIQRRSQQIRQVQRSRPIPSYFAPSPTLATETNATNCFPPLRRRTERLTDLNSVGAPPAERQTRGRQRRPRSVTRSLFGGHSSNNNDVERPPSPPVPSSFEAFTTMLGRVRWSSISPHRAKGRSRRASVVETNSPEFFAHPSNPSRRVGRKRSLSDASAHPPFLRTRDSPARQPLPTVPSLVDIHIRSSLAASEEGSVHLGEAISSSCPGPSTPLPTNVNQNAFVSLPPSLHHLLLVPEPVEQLPTQEYPPAPACEETSQTASTSEPNSISSLGSGAALTIALERHYTEEDIVSLSQSAPNIPTISKAPPLPTSTVIPIGARRRTSVDESRNESRSPPGFADPRFSNRPRSRNASVEGTRSISLTRDNSLMGNRPTLGVRRLGAPTQVPLFWKELKTAQADPALSPKLHRRMESFFEQEKERTSHLSVSSIEVDASLAVATKPVELSTSTSTETSVLNLDKEGSNFTNLVSSDRTSIFVVLM